MSKSKLVGFFFSRWFFASLLLLGIAGLLLFFRFPHGLYDELLNFVSNLLKKSYGSGGNKLKIDTGFHKLSGLLIALALLLFSFFSFWKGLIKKATAAEIPAHSENKFIAFEKRDWLLVGLFTVVGILLRVFWLNQSLWQDEIGVYNTFIKEGIFSTIFPKSSMGSQPLMQIITGLFCKVAGVSEITLRLPVFLFGIAGIGVIYFFTLQLSQDRIAAALATFFLSIHSYHIYYSFQMRGYVMLVLLCMLSCYFLYQILENPKKNTASYFCLVNVLFVYTHLYSVYLLLAQHGVIILFHLYSRYFKKTAQSHYSQATLAGYFTSFLVSMCCIMLLYLPQVPVIFMNILDTANNSKSLMNYVGQVIASLHFMIAYSELAWLSVLLLVLIFVGYFSVAKKSSAVKLIAAISFLLLLITAFVPSGPGFFPRYLICEIPLLLFLMSTVFSSYLKSGKMLFKLIAIAGVLIFTAVNGLGLNLSYQKIQDYKGAVEFVKNYPSAKTKLIVANSLGKTEIKFYDANIIALTDVTELDSLLQLNYDVFAITTYESFVGKSLFVKDKETQAKIESSFVHEKVFAGEFPVNVWHYEKKE